MIKSRKQLFIYFLPQVRKSVVGRWVGDQNLEMLPCVLITEETLDWFPLICDGQAIRKLPKRQEFQLWLEVKLWSPLCSKGPVISKALVGRRVLKEQEGKASGNLDYVPTSCNVPGGRALGRLDWFPVGKPKLTSKTSQEPRIPLNTQGPSEDAQWCSF